MFFFLVFTQFSHWLLVLVGWAGKKTAQGPGFQGLVAIKFSLPRKLTVKAPRPERSLTFIVERSARLIVRRLKEKNQSRSATARRFEWFFSLSENNARNQRNVLCFLSLNREFTIEFTSRPTSKSMERNVRASRTDWRGTETRGLQRGRPPRTGRATAERVSL